MTLAFKFVFVILLELCLFVEYDLGKTVVVSNCRRLSCKCINEET